MRPILCALTVSLPLGLLALLPSAAVFGQGETRSGSDAQLLDEIIERHAEWRGGERWRALIGFRGIGTLRLGTTTIAPDAPAISYTLLRRRPNLVRAEFNTNGETSVQTFDGAQAWELEAADAKAREADEPTTAALRRQAAFDGPLLDAGDSGVVLSIAPSVPEGDSGTTRIRALWPDGAVETYILETSSGALLAMETAAWTMELEWQKIDGMPMVSRQLIHTSSGVQELRFEDYELGDVTPAAAFERPGRDTVAEADLPEIPLDELLERHRAARFPEGSKGASTLEATGTALLQGLELPVTLLYQAPASARFDMASQGLEIVLATNGDEAWTLSPLQGYVVPTALDGKATEAVSMFADFINGLLPRQGSEGVTLMGAEEVRGELAWRLETATAPQSAASSRSVWVSDRDGLERLIEFDTVLMGAPTRVSVELQDWRPVSGRPLPHRMLLKGAGLAIDIEFAQMKSGAAIDGSAFDLPAPPPQP